MKTKLLMFAALTVGLTMTAKAGTVDVTFTLRDYTSKVTASASAHAGGSFYHEGVGTYNSGSEAYSAYNEGTGSYRNVPPPPGHKLASTNAFAAMVAYEDAAHLYEIGAGSITPTSEMEVTEEAAAVMVECDLGAGGGCDGNAWASASCTGEIPSATLHIGTSTTYEYGDSLLMNVAVWCGNNDWTLKVANRVYNNGSNEYFVMDQIPVQAGYDYDFEFSYADSFYIPADAWGWSGSSSGIVTLTLVPEPSAIMLLGTGVVALLAWAWRRRR